MINRVVIPLCLSNHTPATSIYYVTKVDGKTFCYDVFCHVCLQERDSLLVGRCCAVRALKLYPFHDFPQNNLDEIRGNAQMLITAKSIFLMLDFESVSINGTKN